MKKWIPALLIIVIAGIGMIFINNKDISASVLMINEVCSSCARMPSETLISQDYIEIYNCGNETVNLAGWALSDDKMKLDKQILPELNIEPGGYVVFYADGIGIESNTVNFKVSQNGEMIFLSDPTGKIVDQVYVPKLDLNNAYARKEDGGAEWSVLEGTPGKSNNDAVLVKEKRLSAPVLSHETGYYKDEFVLNIAAEAGQKIYYTLDGSIPTETSFLYQEGIPICDRSEEEDVINDVENIVADWNDYYISPEKADKAMVVRAIAMDEKNRCSEVVTATYVIGLEKYKNRKILSVVAEPEQLIGKDGIFITGEEYDQWYLSDEMSKDGIYEYEWTPNYYLANFWLRGRDYEVPAEVQFIENGKEIFSQTVGLRTQGNYTRMLNKKSLQLISRNMYSQNRYFAQQIFEGYNSHAIYVSVFPEKAYCMNLAKGRNLGIQQAEEYDLFMNGEYWYTAVLMEKYDADYFAEHYGVKAENILCIKDFEAAEGENSISLYNDLFHFVCDETISKEQRVEALYEQIDVQSFIDWLCFHLYVCNDDVSYKKNSILWRTIAPEDNKYGDCKWRWVLYDIDHVASIIAPETETFQDFSVVAENPFYWVLRSSEEFCEQMVLTAMDMLNTIFSLENVSAVLGEWQKDLDYGNGFFIKRPEYMIKSLKNEFGLSGSVEEVYLSVNESEAGCIQINTTKAIMEEDGWMGLYFTDYPIRVSAIANDGYRFVGWSGDVESKEKQLEISLTKGGTTLKAIFEKEQD